MHRLRSLLPALVACVLVALAALLPAAAPAQTGGAAPEAGDERRSSSPRQADRDEADAEDADPEEPARSEDPAAGAPAGRARIVGGQAVAPARAPRAVKAAIAAANAIAQMPYRYGGGHGNVEDTAYDCSGAVSYALIKAGLLASPLSSGPLMRWGEPGPGRWITVYAHGSHAFVMIAGLRFDTGFRGPEAALIGTAPGQGPRWGYGRQSAGFVARHPAGL